MRRHEAGKILRYFFSLLGIAMEKNVVLRNLLILRAFRGVDRVFTNGWANIGV